MDAMVDDADWAVTEFGRAALGDKRRTERLVALATLVGRRPPASLPQACDDPAARKGAYRFVENAAIAPDAILASHAQATQERMAGVARVLAVQDSTHLDRAVPGAPDGQWVHTTLALTPERVPLGVLAQERWCRSPEEAGKRHTRRERAIADKESHKWLTSLRAVNAAAAACPGTALVSVGDREADGYDLFLEERAAGVDLLVRAAQDRCVAAEEDAALRRLRAGVVDLTRFGGHPEAWGSQNPGRMVTCPRVTPPIRPRSVPRLFASFGPAANPWPRSPASWRSPARHCASGSNRPTSTTVGVTMG